ncbi:MAG: hypothetical protein ACTSSC_11120 [Promethearchaeota archaeon]
MNKLKPTTVRKGVFDFHIAYHYTLGRIKLIFFDKFYSHSKCSLGVEDLQQAVSNQISLGVVFMMLSYLGISLIEMFMRSSDSVWVATLLAAA